MKRNSIIIMRLTAEDKESWKAAASATGKTLSRWIRETLAGEVRTCSGAGAASGEDLV